MISVLISSYEELVEVEKLLLYTRYTAFTSRQSKGVYKTITRESFEILLEQSIILIKITEIDKKYSVIKSHDLPLNDISGNDLDSIKRKLNLPSYGSRKIMV